MKNLDNKIEQDIVELHSLGQHTLIQIAEKVGVSRKTVSNVLKRHGVREIRKKVMVKAGQTFGDLSVIRYVEKTLYGNKVFLCKCSCGNTVKIRAPYLTENRKKNCGCKPEETSADTEIRLLNSARWRANKKGIPFNLELSDIKIPERCPVLGIPIRKGGGKVTPNSPSLDRIYPRKGYTRENTKVISHRANNLKSNSTLEELRKVIKYMEKSK